jgi:periplasmic divalent cation tolerance protein
MVSGPPDRLSPADPVPASSSCPAVLVVTTTVPTEADATRIAETVVAERLVACGQVQGPIHSIFHWQGAVDRATEWYVHCKTAAPRLPELLARLAALHPYDVPEIIATPILDGHRPYLQWVEDSVRRETEDVRRARDP